MVQVRKLESEAIAGSIDIDAWLQRLRDTLEIDDLALISKACSLAQEAAPKRPNAKAFAQPARNCFYAGLEMAEILADFKLDLDSLVAAILYRAVREGRLPLATVRQEFGDAVCKLVEGVQQMAVISAVRTPAGGTEIPAHVLSSLASGVYFLSARNVPTPVTGRLVLRGAEGSR